MKTADRIHGFICTDVIDLPDFAGTMYRMKHEKTNCELVYLKREDENKTFAITFRTPPENDTGVFHILEHSVLNGSDRYPVREPFVELLKGSMNTFLNAMTFDDKTMFPVASRNEKDFMNLVAVYMDAVFHPEIYRNPKIFMQEGWHYELHDEKEEPVYKGVVLNEMKGAYASVDETLVSHISRALFPDTCYQYSSGGDPAHITDLTYEQFIAAHKRFYHPSNARIFLDGEMDLEKMLAFLDDEYLSHYEAIEPHTEIAHQQPVKAATTVYDYECEDEDLSNRTIIAMARICCEAGDVKRSTAMSILSEVLTGSNDAPLKAPFLKAGLCEDVSFDLYDAIAQPWAAVTFRNTEKDKLEEIRALYKKTMNSLIENGLDHEELEAALSRAEFAYREKQEPAGVLYSEVSMMSWLYDKDPSLFLNASPVFEELHQAIKDNYFEDLLREMMADEAHTQTVIAVPSHTAGQKRIEAEKEKIAAAHLNKAELVAQTAELEKWQNTPDTPAQLATLPHLALSDVDPNPREDHYTEEEYKGITLLHYPRTANGITYINLYYNTAGVTRDLLPQMAFFTSLFTDLPTAKHSVRELQILINRYIGSLNFSTGCFADMGDNEACTPVIMVRFSCLEKNTAKALALVHEILTETEFEPTDIYPLLKQTRQAFKEALIGSGHAFARLRIAAACSSAGAFDEYTHGIENGRYLRLLDENYQKLGPDFADMCQVFAENLFINSRLKASYAGDVTEEMHAFLDRFPSGDAHFARVHYPFLKKENEGFIIPGGVAYAAKGNAFPDTSGVCRVLTHILTYEYLWNEVRVKGGAYGTGINAGGGSTAIAYSYRDPDPGNALRAMDHCADFMQAMDSDKPDYTDYIIGAIAAGSPLLTPGAKMYISDVRWFSHISYEDRKKRRTEMLKADGAQLKAEAEALNAAMQNGMVCVIGPEEKLKDLKAYHLDLHTLF